ncbi:hypothetical protein [Paraliomyxa miuraensis]|uniref:hypothetical protein n=1 Tax=Paraliomyxa miuraensis TaxID=376150 RepID=UPI002254346B|nr:hypothetical protein [Paraliomyxa miuraensis]MCX4242148.1 hypothetical protein [Paraliomyxa miuraensis]
MLHRFLKAGLLTLPLLISGCPDDPPPMTTGEDSSSTTDPPTSTTLPPLTATDTMGTGNMTSVTSSADTTVGPPPTTDATTVGPDDTTTTGPMTTGPGSTGPESTGPATTGGGDDGNCCVPHPATGCEVPAVETCVCALDPFCCSMEWDGICVDEAINDCAANCPGGGTEGTSMTGGTGGGGGDCCAANGTPGCDDPACEAAVCALDPFCCSMEWDGICADEATMECPVLCPPMATGGTGVMTTGVGTGGGDPSCCVPHGFPGCDDPACEAAVCALDPFCCSTEWDGICVDEAGMECGMLCPPGGTGGSGGFTTGVGTGGGDPSCCVPHPFPGCDDPGCEMVVCALDPFCCSTEWDGICVDEAGTECGMLCPPGGTGGSGGITTGVGTGGTGGVGGDCCAANGSPGCDDPVCETAVCALDPFCCSTEWDGICADEAELECPVLCPGGGGTGGGTGGVGGDCCAANVTPGCDDPACEAAVCAVDPFCCSSQWDDICADEALMECPMLCP